MNTSILIILTTILLVLLSNCSEPINYNHTTLPVVIESTIEETPYVDIDQQQSVSEESTEGFTNNHLLSEQERHCLALTMTKEAEGEGYIGMKMVADVVMNRVESREFPNTICGVMKQRSKRGCMFSFWCEPNNDVIRNKKVYDEIYPLTASIIRGDYQRMTNTLHYKVCNFNSRFFNTLTRVERYKNHCFYE